MRNGWALSSFSHTQEKKAKVMLSTFTTASGTIHSIKSSTSKNVNKPYVYHLPIVHHAMRSMQVNQHLRVAWIAKQHFGLPKSTFSSFEKEEYHYEFRKKCFACVGMIYKL